MQTTEAQAKAQALAHWEILVQAGTPEAVAEIEEQGMRGRTPADAKIAALDCLRRIGTPEAVDAIGGYLLCDLTGEFARHFQKNVVKEQFAALLGIATDDAYKKILELVGGYERGTFHGDNFAYSAPQMYVDIESALKAVNTPFADRIAYELAKSRPNFAGYARAYLLTRDTVDTAKIKELEVVLQGRTSALLKHIHAEGLDVYVARIVRDVAPFVPIATMRALCGIQTNLDFGGEIKAAINTGASHILKEHPQQQRELIEVILEKSLTYNRWFSALADFVKAQKGTPNEAQVEMDIIDAYAAKASDYTIECMCEMIEGLPKDSPVVDYGLRKLVSMNYYPYRIRSLVREHFPERAVDVMRLYLEQSAERPSSYTTARYMANIGTPSDRDEFIAHCIANPSYDSIRQIRHLNINPAVAARLLLQQFGHPTAVKEVGQMAKFCPDVAIKALLDAREARLQAGDHSVWVHEDVILTAVAGMATPKKLQELAAGENRIVIQTIFDRVAQSAIIDARAAFGAAVGLLQAERAHEQAIGKLAAACGLVAREVK